MLTADALSNQDGIRHGFFTRQGGVSAGVYASLNVGFGSSDETDLIAENRRRAAETLGFTADCLTTVRQIHSAKVALAAAPWDHAASPEGDALVTRTPGVLIGILTADCAPVLFADAAAGVVGAAHAGWKGAKGGVLEATLDAMEGLGAKAENTVAVVGPCIAQASYEVGEAFYLDFLGEASGNTRFFSPGERAGHYQFDLEGYVRARLSAMGVGWVDGLGLDTYQDEARFYSYRRACHAGEVGYGRLLSAIASAV